MFKCTGWVNKPVPIQPDFKQWQSLPQQQLQLPQSAFTREKMFTVKWLPGTTVSRCYGCGRAIQKPPLAEPDHLVVVYRDIREYKDHITDPCKSQYIKEDNWQRSTSFIASSSSSRHCDSSLVSTQWIRFTSKAGTTMPTQCPAPYSCGTEGSIWLNGSYPQQIAETNTVPVCVSMPGNCCSKTWNIEIRRCLLNGEEFFIHKLKPAPSCPMFYCAGTEVPCKPGFNSPTGFTPMCTRQYPAVSNVRLRHEVKEKRLQFVCEFSSEDKNNNDTFEITWWESAPAKQLNQVNILKGRETKGILRNNHTYPNRPLFHLGTTVFPEQLQFRLSEKDKPLELQVVNTVPVICQENPQCFVIVELGQTNSDSFLDTCTLMFKAGKMNETKTINIVAKRDFIDDGDHTMAVKFHIFDHIDPVDWNNHRKIPDVQIMSVDVGTERCTSTGDPHLTTFDKFYYHHYQVGDYVLVRSTCRRFEVHVRTWKCASVSCNCGVAVREGDDVVVVDMCRDKIPRARFASTVQPHKDTRIQRNKNGKSYMISLPSGAFVRIDMHRWYGNLWYANIQVQVVSDDFGCTEGLCGTFDGNRANDPKQKNSKITSGFRHGQVAPPQFSESWRLGVGKSLFYYKGGPRNCTAQRVKHYCTCEETCCGSRNIKCDFTGYANRPKYRQGFEGWKDLNFPGGQNCGKRRKRRSTDENIILPDDDNDLANYVYNPKPLVIVAPQWPTASGKTQATVKAYCEQEINNSTAAKICSKLLDNINFTKFVSECVADVQITDDKTLAMSAVDSLQSYCEEKSLKDITLWKKDSENGTLQPPDEIANILCPNQCSGNGKCINATCYCEPGYTTADCSMKIGEKPLLDGGLLIGGLCDIRKRACTRIRISGRNFIDSDKLSCHAILLKVTDQGYTTTTSTLTGRGYLLSFAEVMCEFSVPPVMVNDYESLKQGRPAAGYSISVSNDGRNFSDNHAIFTAYDSKCMQCNNTGFCTQKNDTCKINGYCFKSGEAKPRDSCRRCQPVVDANEFTRRIDKPAPVFDAMLNYTAFKNQYFTMQIRAKDSKNQSVYFLPDKKYDGVSISISGLFRWKPSTVKEHEFKVVAFYSCIDKTTLTVKINVIECKCEHGNCSLIRNTTRNGEAVVECNCPLGCTGEKAKQDASEFKVDYSVKVSTPCRNVFVNETYESLELNITAKQ
eukprot:gene12371-13641_t